MKLLFNYNNAGSGVAKNGPKKKPFFKFWEIFARKFWKFFCINALYLIFCLPIVTFGPATAAMTQLMRRFVLEQPIFIWHDFWKEFKKNFRQSVGVGIADVLFIGCFVFAIYYYDNMLNVDSSMQNMLLMAVTVATAAFVFMMHFYIYLQIVALNLNLNAIIKNSMKLVVIGLKSNIITLLVCIVVITAFVLLYPYSLLVLPLIPFAWLSFVIVFNSYPVITRAIINPYYEARGERNPELPSEEENEEAVFEDMGGKEEPVKVKTKAHGKVIH